MEIKLWLSFFLSVFLIGCGSVPVYESGKEGLFEKFARFPPGHKKPLGNFSHRELQWPVKEVVINSHFGRRGRRQHEGIDFKAKVGTPVYAAHSGRVVYAGRMSGYGNLIVLQSPTGVHTVYAHLSKFYSSKNEWVKVGEKIASSGKTGRVTGPHLHFEVRDGSTPVDPIAFYEKQGIRVDQRSIASHDSQ